MGNFMRYANHSCAPNAACIVVRDCFGRNRLMYYTKRAVTKAEEITFDYLKDVDGNTLEDGPRLECLCGARNCRGTLPGF